MIWPEFDIAEATDHDEDDKDENPVILNQTKLGIF